MALTARALTTSEQVHLYNSFGKRAPVWAMFGIFDGDYLRVTGNGKSMPRLFDNKAAADALLAKLNAKVK